MQEKIFIGIQWFAGLMLVIIGVGKLMGFLSVGAVNPAMADFLAALSATGYLMELVAVVEIVAGVAFLLNRYTALMAVVLMPVLINALLAHLFLNPGSIGSALVLLLTLSSDTVYGSRNVQSSRTIYENPAAELVSS